MSAASIFSSLSFIPAIESQYEITGSLHDDCVNRLEGFIPSGSIGEYQFVTQAGFAAVTANAGVPYLNAACLLVGYEMTHGSQLLLLC